MNLLTSLFGPASKYLHDIPYTYEARVPTLYSSDEYNSYLADTICALVGHLEKLGIDYREVAIYEVYHDREKRLDIHYCTNQDGSWLSREELCDSFKMYYLNHIWFCGCSFSDRDQRVSGP